MLDATSEGEGTGATVAGIGPSMGSDPTSGAATGEGAGVVGSTTSVAAAGAVAGEGASPAGSRSSCGDGSGTGGALVGCSTGTGIDMSGIGGLEGATGSAATACVGTCRGKVFTRGHV